VNGKRLEQTICQSIFPRFTINSAAAARGEGGIKLEHMQTPCVKVCTYDPQTGLCRGCGRTLDEIAAWTSMSGKDRQKVMEELPGRIRRLSLPAS
jgi:hypothetical protein